MAIGILAAWWWSFPVFFGAYFGLAFIDLRIQRWKLAHYQKTGRWPWEQESDFTEDERMLRDVDRAAREVGMPPAEFVYTTRRFMAIVDQAGAQKGERAVADPSPKQAEAVGALAGNYGLGDGEARNVRDWFRRGGISDERIINEPTRDIAQEAIARLMHRCPDEDSRRLSEDLWRDGVLTALDKIDPQWDKPSPEIVNKVQGEAR